MTRGLAALAGLATVALALAYAWPGRAAATSSRPPAAQARSDYIENCAGCHGIGGSSAPARVPELRGRVGYFLCTPSGRDYLVRLPNVAHAPLPEPQALADLLNYVVFELGGASAPAGAVAYRADEVDRLRRDPLLHGSLLRERARLVADVRRHCPATPASLNDYSAGLTTRTDRPARP